MNQWQWPMIFVVSLQCSWSYWEIESTKESFCQSRLLGPLSWNTWLLTLNSTNIEWTSSDHLHLHFSILKNLDIFVVTPKNHCFTKEIKVGRVCHHRSCVTISTIMTLIIVNHEKVTKSDQGTTIGCCVVWHKVTIFWKKFVVCRIHIGQDLVKVHVEFFFGMWSVELHITL